MNRVCAYCGTRFLDRLTTTAWRRRGPSEALKWGVFVTAVVCSTLIYLLVLFI
ncbi:MAG: hypothetical protein ABIY55_32350 [Kofleriaceae bacterium]